jgi:hypothetical protein
MNENRAGSQELPGQVIAAARKGQERVTKSVKHMTAAAQQFRPQLANLSVPTPAQLREKAPEFVANLPAKLPPRLQQHLPNRLPNRLPSPEQLRASAQEFAGHARSVQRLVADQVRNVATPLAHQAAARLAQVGTANGVKAEPETGTTTKVRQVTVTKSSQPADKPGTSDKPGTAKTTKADETPKPKTRPAGATSAAKSSSSKPKSTPADK